MIEIKHKQTAKVLLRINADTLEGANLTGAKLAGANLAGIKINLACLRDVDLQGAMLGGAQLIGACLDGANLSHAMLEAADLTDASLQRAELSQATLVNATLRYAKLSGASLVQAKLSGADLSMADARANWRFADLRSTDFRGANLTGANLQQANLLGADLTGATITRSAVATARMQGAVMQKVVYADAVAPMTDITTRSSMQHHLSDANLTSSSQELGNRLRVTCPYCGQRQKFVREQLDHHSACAGCGKRFFIDRLGNARERKKGDASQWMPELQSGDAYAPASATWEIPWRIGLPIVAIAVVLLGGWLGWTLLAREALPPLEIPEGLLRRAEFVCEAYVGGDERRVLAVTAPGMSSAAQQWLDSPTAEAWTKQYAENPVVKVESQILFEGRDLHAGVVTDVKSRSGPSKPLELQLLTFWMKDSSGQWVLDADSTLAGMLKRR